MTDTPTRSDDADLHETIDHLHFERDAFMRERDELRVALDLVAYALGLGAGEPGEVIRARAEGAMQDRDTGLRELVDIDRALWPQPGRRVPKSRAEIIKELGAACDYANRLVDERDNYTRSATERAVAAERERCAALCDLARGQALVTPPVRDAVPDILESITSLIREGSSVETFAGLKPAPTCPHCGASTVRVRGRRLADPTRRICPTCAAERLDQIGEIASPGYGVPCGEKEADSQ